MFDLNDSKIHRDNLEESYSSYIFVTLENGEEERQPILYVEATSYANTNEKHLIILNKGGREKQSDKIVESYGTSDGVIMETLVDDIKLWVGNYIQLLELYKFDENSVHNELKKSIRKEYTQYNNWVNNLSTSDRQIRLLNQAESDNEWDPLYKDIIKIGTWRNHSQSKDVKSFANAIHKNMEFKPNSCYKNARRVIQKDRYWNNENVEYCEGIFLSKTAARIVGHGWIEHNNRIVELTLPWHIPLPPEEAIYFGAEVSRDTLKCNWNKDEYGPYILNLDESQIA